MVLVSTALVPRRSVVGMGIATWQSIRAGRPRSGKEQCGSRARESEELATLGLEVLDDIYLDVLGDRLARKPEVTAEQRQLLRSGLDYYERFVRRSQRDAESDLVIANAHRQIGLIYGRLGESRKRSSAYRQAISLIRAAGRGVAGRT